MDFVKPNSDSLAWGLFFTVFTITSFLNGAIAWLLHKSLIQQTFTKLLAFIEDLSARVILSILILFNKLVEWWKSLW